MMAFPKKTPIALSKNGSVLMVFAYQYPKPSWQNKEANGFMEKPFEMERLVSRIDLPIHSFILSF